MSLNKYLKIAVVSLFILLVSLQAGKSFVLDELDFPIVSHATSQTLKPIYYRGDVVPDRPDTHKPLYYVNSLPAHVGTYHPTLYINSLATFIRIFGYSEVSIRLFGLICVLLSAYLLVLILRQLGTKNEKAELLLLGLYLLNPYTIANATLPDIDSTILPVLLLLFVYYSLRLLLQKKYMNNQAMFILGGLFALALWSKLTTPMILPVFLLGLAFITTKNYRKSLVFTAKVTIVGVVTFVITYFLYCKLLGLSTTYTYGFLVDSFTKGTSTDGPLIGALRNLKNTQTFVYWPTIPVVGLLVAALISLFSDKDKGERTKIKKLLVGLALLVTIFYIALISPFGGFFKYPFPVFGILILSIVFFYEKHLHTLSLNKYYIIVATAVGFIFEKLLWSDSMFKNSKPYSYLWLVLLTGVIGFFAIRYTKHRYAQILLVTVLCLTVGFQVSISRIQAMSDYSTKYLYGQTGLDQATAYLRSNTKPDEVIWSMKDVGYYVNNRYYESYEFYFDKSYEANLIKMLEEGKVRYYVVTTGIGQDNIDYYVNIKQILDTHATKDRQFGNFIIYKTKG